MEFEDFPDFRDDLLISAIKRKKKEYGLLYYPWLYMAKYGFEKQLKKLRRYYEKLSKWHNVMEFMCLRCQSQEARILSDDLNCDNCLFSEYHFDSASDFLIRKIRELEEEPSLEEYINELKEFYGL